MDRLFSDLPSRSYTIRVDPAASVAAIRETLARVFDKQSVSVTEGSVEQPGDIVVEQDGAVVASSSAAELMESVLLVNSDVYMTGSRTLAESELPDVLRALDEVPFLLRGYPESDTEKLLLIAVSRAVERAAHEAGEGTLHVGFQQLSRLVDEPGTYRVYEQLSERDIDVHVYGVGDVPVPSELDCTVHTGTARLYRRGWFVVFQPEATDAEPAGLFSTEREHNRWGGFWTFDSERVASIMRVIDDATMRQPPDDTNSRKTP